ncbi:MAG: alpha-amylase family glycosyl hydrolase [Candidatus Sericytochromatia bacterium]|nr:alpha-amylase family glycosyl hydrolase [Candidatus Sericytochromatia bacterium]
MPGCHSANIKRGFAAAMACLALLAGCGTMPLPGLARKASAGVEASKRGKQLTRWRDEVIYFVLTDRFHNGDRGNDRAVRPRDPHAYHGGDFAGLIQKLPYIKDLGATAIWITPVQDNREDAFVDKYWGFHGYWITDFNRVDEHLGDEALLRRLVAEAHKMGIKVMLDIVVNHAGYGAPITLDPAKKDWFHHNGNINNWNDQYQLENHDIHGLPDFNTENPAVLDFMARTWTDWAERSGVDGYRVDTVKHVPIPFWRQFNTRLAQHTGSDFLMLGEVLNGDPNYVAPYTREGRFDTVFDFPMYFTMTDVFARGQSMRKLGERLRQDGAYQDPSLLTTFIDNHDVPRFLSVANHDERRLRLALAFLMTARGIPSVYYGTEVGMDGAGEPENRQDMAFGANPKLTSYVKNLTALRRELSPLRRGRMLEMWQDDAVYAFSRVGGDHGRTRDEVIVALNNSDRHVQVTMPLRAESAIAPGTRLRDRLGGGEVVVTDRRVTLKLGPKQAQVLVPGGDRPSQGKR